MPVIAQLTPQEITRSYSNYLESYNLDWIPVAIGVLLTILVLLVIWQVRHAVAVRRRPRLLFYDLAVVHGLGRQMQKRILHSARLHKVSDPAYLFVCPDLVARIESLELSHARGDKERARAKEFFEQFRTAVFGS